MKTPQKKQSFQCTEVRCGFHQKNVGREPMSSSRTDPQAVVLRVHYLPLCTLFSDKRTKTKNIFYYYVASMNSLGKIQNILRKKHNYIINRNPFYSFGFFCVLFCFVFLHSSSCFYFYCPYGWYFCIVIFFRLAFSKHHNVSLYYLSFIKRISVFVHNILWHNYKFFLVKKF